MGIGRISSGEAFGPVEGSGAAKPGQRLFLTSGLIELVYPHVFLHFPLNPRLLV